MGGTAAEGPQHVAQRQRPKVTGTDGSGGERQHEAIRQNFHWSLRGGGSGEMAISEKAAADNFPELEQTPDLSFQNTAQILTGNSVFDVPTGDEERVILKNKKS